GKVALPDGGPLVPTAVVAVTTTSGDQVLRTPTHANGHYNTQRVLPPDTCLVGAGGGTGLAVTYYVSAKSLATATPIPVLANSDTTGINVRLSSSAGGISGRVTSAASGAPLASVGVRVFDAATGGVILVVSTDATGHHGTG